MYRVNENFICKLEQCLHGHRNKNAIEYYKLSHFKRISCSEKSTCWKQSFASLGLYTKVLLPSNIRESMSHYLDE